MNGEDAPVEDIAASFRTRWSVQVHKVTRAARYGRLPCGPRRQVAANTRLRERLGKELKGRGINLYYPPLDLCADNAAMVASLGWRMLDAGEVSPLDIDAAAVLPLGSSSVTSP